MADSTNRQRLITSLLSTLLQQKDLLIRNYPGFLDYQFHAKYGKNVDRILDPYKFPSQGDGLGINCTKVFLESMCSNPCTFFGTQYISSENIWCQMEGNLVPWKQ